MRGGSQFSTDLSSLCNEKSILPFFFLFFFYRALINFIGRFTNGVGEICVRRLKEIPRRDEGKEVSLSLSPSTSTHRVQGSRNDGETWRTYREI